MADAIDKIAEEPAPKKSSGQIYLQELEEGIDALKMTPHRLAISGFAAGLELGLSLLFVAIVLTQGQTTLSRPVLELLLALMSSFGFIAVILGRSELFTEQTTLAILPLLSGNATMMQVARLWAIVYSANIAGAAACAAFIVLIGPLLRDVEPAVFAEIASRKIEHPWWVIVLSGVLAGWIMGLLSWLVAAGRDTISQVVIILIFTGAIGLGHLHHSILGTTEVLGGVFTSDRVRLSGFAHFLLWTTIGNAVGGTFFVALLKFGHAHTNECPQH